MLQVKILNFIDALLPFFEKERNLYCRLITHHHEIKNRLNEDVIFQLCSSFATPDICLLIKNRDPSFLNNTLFKNDLENILDSSTCENVIIIWKWLNSIKNDILVQMDQKSVELI